MYRELVVAGILLSVLYYEMTHFSPGGMVTPAYFAVCLTAPWRIFYTLALAAVVCLVLKGLSQIWILYGRRRFSIAVLLVFLLEMAFSGLGVLPFGLQAIGYVVPALIVRDTERQGIAATAVSLGIVTGFLALAMLWMGVL